MSNKKWVNSVRKKKQKKFDFVYNSDSVTNI